MSEAERRGVGIRRGVVHGQRSTFEGAYRRTGGSLSKSESPPIASLPPTYLPVGPYQGYLLLLIMDPPQNDLHHGITIMRPTVPR